MPLPRLVLVAAVIAAIVAAPAAAAPLRATVTRMDLDPTIVVVPADAAANPIARYQARTAGPVAARTPLVALIRLPPANSPDTVTVVDARRRGHRVIIAIETRRFDGPIHGNVVAVPLIEVELGALAAGSYEVQLDETVLTFTKFDAPDTARDPHPGLGTTQGFTVR